MSFKCKIGLHNWIGCQCIECGQTRDKEHDWSKDCEKCEKCGKVRENGHHTHYYLDRNCEICSVCGKPSRIEHNWSKDCEKCDRCLVTRENRHDWSIDCTLCRICGKIRSVNHEFKDDGYCIICGLKIEDTFTDIRDGKTYKTIRIGIQIWMAENLAFKIEKECWTYDDNIDNAAIYGYLYQFPSIDKACPEGWHIPSTKEWETMLSFVCKQKNSYPDGPTYFSGAGSLLRSSEDWVGLPVKNMFNFSALAGGCCSYSEYTDSKASYKEINETAAWWSKSNAFKIDRRYNGGHVDYFYWETYPDQEGCVKFAHSIRCIKD